MDIQTQKKLDYLEETKQLLRAAIEEKGQTINDSDSFRSYVDKVRAITTGGGSAELRYVTFKDDTGTVEYGKKAVAVGDDCADPIARGIFSTPTKESTDQYNFTFSGGWATTPGGGKDSNALKAVTEDRTVYANFISAVRYYNITFYDSDGTTVLDTKSVAYGSVPSYTPTKNDYDFAGWQPSLTAVTGEASYTATWNKKATFATATWAEIAAVCEAGNASSTFKVGDEKEFTITYADGSTEKNVFIVAGFNNGILQDGTTASMTLVTKYALQTKRSIMFTWKNQMYYYKTSDLAKWLDETFASALPADLQSSIKPKNIGHSENDNTFHKCWIPSLIELNLSRTNYMADSISKSLSLFSSNEKRIRKLGISGAATVYLTRSFKMPTQNSSTYFACVSETGTTHGGNTTSSTEQGVVVGICI